MCLYDGLTHVWVHVFVKMFRFAIEQFIYCNMEKSTLLRQTRLHVREARFEWLVGAYGSLAHH